MTDAPASPVVPPDPVVLPAPSADDRVKVVRFVDGGDRAQPREDSVWFLVLHGYVGAVAFLLFAAFIRIDPSDRERGVFDFGLVIDVYLWAMLGAVLIASVSAAAWNGSHVYRWIRRRRRSSPNDDGIRHKPITGFGWIVVLVEVATLFTLAPPLSVVPIVLLCVLLIPRTERGLR